MCIRDRVDGESPFERNMVSFSKVNGTIKNISVLDSSLEDVYKRQILCPVLSGRRVKTRLRFNCNTHINKNLYTMYCITR